MNYRLFSKKHNLYTNSLLWPSNQRTWSEWNLTPDGQILEIIFDGTAGYNSDPIGCLYHDKRNFAVEPWTGFLDLNNKKIYLGDILEMNSMFDFKSEVAWKDGSFWLKALDSEGIDQEFKQLYAKLWKITGNIHNVEFHN